MEGAVRMLERKILAGRVAVVTGASRGIGRAIALALAGHGASVVLAARDGDRLAQVVGEIEAAGGAAAACTVDLRNPAGPGRAVEAAQERFGRLDILVNNAGDTRFGPFESLTDEDFASGFSLKYDSTVRACRAAWPLLKESRGVVINIAGVGGRVPGPNFAIGGSVNAAVMALTKSLAAYGIDHGVRVLSVNPGSVETDRLRTSIGAWAQANGITGDEMVRQMVADAKTLRLGRPEEIANLVAFLVSPAAGWMTGTLVDIDGGAVKGI
jgi:3-oxoacyl-[acyl-carrier protein] reductase